MPNTGIYTRREQFNAVENKHTRVGTLEIDASDVEQTPRMNKITIAAHAHTHTMHTQQNITSANTPHRNKGKMHLQLQQWKSKRDRDMHTQQIDA